MKDQSSVSLAGALETTDEDFLELLRMLAHRLSQPLTSLRGSIEVALMGQLDVSECKGVLKLSLQESHRMAEALETLREVLELESTGEPVQPVSWTREVEELLEDGAPSGRNCGNQLLATLQENIWVNTSRPQLGAATARLIAGAIRAARKGRLVRVSLSAVEGSARLAVCEEDASPDVEAGSLSSPKALEAQVLAGLDRCVVRRAIERHGGRLTINQNQDACCYILSLPLAMPEVAGEVLS